MLGTVGKRYGAKSATAEEVRIVAGSEMVRRIDASERHTDLEAASGCPSIKGPSHSLGPATGGGEGGGGGTGGRFSLLADEDGMEKENMWEGTMTGADIEEESGEDSDEFIDDEEVDDDYWVG